LRFLKLTEEQITEIRQIFANFDKLVTKEDLRAAFGDIPENKLEELVSFINSDIIMHNKLNNPSIDGYSSGSDDDKKSVSTPRSGSLPHSTKNRLVEMGFRFYKNKHGNQLRYPGNDDNESDDASPRESRESKYQLSPEQVRQYEMAFQIYDNNSGVITVTQLRHMMQNFLEEDDFILLCDLVKAAKVQALPVPYGLPSPRRVEDPKRREKSDSISIYQFLTAMTALHAHPRMRKLLGDVSNAKQNIGDVTSSPREEINDEVKLRRLVDGLQQEVQRLREDNDLWSSKYNILESKLSAAKKKRIVNLVKILLHHVNRMSN